MIKKNTNAPDDQNSSPKDLRRQGKIDQIVQAATDVFLEDGFAAASMDRIVEKAGVSKRTLYSYYGSKEKIFIDVMQKHLGLLYRNFELNGTTNESLAEQLQRVGVDMLRIANSDETLSLFRLTAAEAQRFPKLAQHFFEERFNKVIDGIAVILDREIRGSGLHITDTKQAGEYFLDLLFGTAYHRVVFGNIPPMNDKAIKERTRRALEYFIKTYKSPQPGGLEPAL